MDDHALAYQLADRAGAQLVALRDRPDVLDVGAVGDRSSHEYIAGQLAAARPHDAVLSEEAVDDQSRLASDRVWIVDPLDGTREYGEPGRTDWAVHVALWERGDLVAGAVGLPAQGRVLSTAAPPVVPPEHESADGREIRIAVSRSRAPALVIRLAELVDGQLMALGSAGAKVAAVLLGEVEAYVHAGGQHEWDSAAPVAVARAAGLHASRIDGSPLRYNQPDPSLPDLLVCRAELAEPLLDALAKVAAE
ncbi:MAG TPA: 3'(2'),5'-bisphosphate nucleotidase CysQ [Actinomycetes bacterium]|nr:3'(2'),5'-bisphosphate nucleotidase CysQ [Actinomycetes bacterium]